MTMKVYFASDHAGFDAKNELVEYVRDQLKCEVEDCGALVNDPQDDYPGIIAVAAKKLSEDVAAGKDSRAIVAGASGQGEAIVANRFKGVRCALYYGDPGNQQVLVTLGTSKWTLPENIWIFSCRRANTTTQMRSPSAFGFLLSIKPKTPSRAGSQHRFPEKRATHAGLLR